MKSEGAVTLVACLCAQWCGTCREFRATFEALQTAFPQLTWRWLDIEDDADMVEALEVETFPALLIAQGSQLLFGGPVTPRLYDCRRLIETVLRNLSPGQAAVPQVAPLEAAAYTEVLAQILR